MIDSITRAHAPAGGEETHPVMRPRSSPARRWQARWQVRGPVRRIARIAPTPAGRAQNGFQVGSEVNLRYPTFTPSRAPTPDRIGTTTISSFAAAVTPKPPTRYAAPLSPTKRV